VPMSRIHRVRNCLKEATVEHGFEQLTLGREIVGGIVPERATAELGGEVLCGRTNVPNDFGGRVCAAGLLACDHEPCSCWHVPCEWDCDG